MRLEFDEPNHVYTLGNRVLPGVTQLLDPLIDFTGIPRSILEAAKERGQFVHKACEMYLWGTLDENSVPEEFIPYLNAFKLFLNQTDFQTEIIEQRVYHKKLLYAGTIDMGGVFPALGRRVKPHRALIDIKTTFKLMRVVGPQTFAYSDAWASMNPKELHFDERYGLQLKADGTYKLERMTAPADRNTFLSCLNIYNFMTQEAA